MNDTQTYQVLADDGNQYGPIMESELRAWIREGRVQKHNQIWWEGSPEWKQLGEHPIFRGLFAPPVARPIAAPAQISTPPRPAVAGPEIGTRTLVLSYVLCILAPLFGFFAGIYLMAKKQHGHGVACMVISIIIGLLFLAMFNS